MTSRRLIVSADDFGLARAVDRGIARAVAAGAVTSVSVMANLAAADTVRALSAAHPGLSLGAHLNLTTGRPLRPARDVSTLVDEAGDFLPLATLMRRALRAALDGGQLVRELEAQVTRLLEHGVRIDHLDSHEHVHILPGVTGAVIEVARRTGVRRLRCHRPRLFPRATPNRAGRIASYYRRHPRRIVSHVLKRALAARFGLAGFTGPDGVVSPALLLDPPPAGSLAEWQAVCAALPAGTWELVTHPADLDVPLDGRERADLGELVERRAAELAALVSPAFRAMLRAHDVTPVSFAAVDGPPPVSVEENAMEAHARRA